MPIPRRIIKIGGGRYVAVPPAWLQYYEKKYGRPVEIVLMEINSVITISIEENSDSNGLEVGKL